MAYKIIPIYSTKADCATPTNIKAGTKRYKLKTAYDLTFCSGRRLTTEPCKIVIISPVKREIIINFV